jgi:type I restriction enzyme S subunit
MAGDFPFYKVGDISEAWKRGDVYLTDAKHYLDRSEVSEIRAKPLPKDTTVFAKIGAAIALNRRAILSAPALVDNNVMGLHPSRDTLDHKFLFHFVCTVKLNELSRATTVPSIRKSDIEQIQIPIPPLPEQRRIVAEIEKQFTRLEAGVAALKRVKAGLKRYRAAVLKAAIGADDSPRISLVELVEARAKVLYGILQPGPEIVDGIPYVRPTEIHLDKIQLGEIRKTSREIASKYTRSTLRTGDIILSIVGTIGKVATVPAELDGGNITQSSVRIRPDKSKVRGDYLAWVLRSPFAVRQYDAARLGTAVPRLNVAHVRDLQIPVPAIAEQTRIVAEVERRLSVIEELEAVVSANLQRAGRLRQSILRKAFRGDLS